jgi:hypothetical protein
MDKQMNYTQRLEGMQFRTRENLMTDSVEVFAFLRDGENAKFINSFTVNAPQSAYLEPPSPAFNLTHEQAAMLYEELGRVLGRLDSATLESVVKAQEKHLADLREITFRVLK